MTTTTATRSAPLTFALLSVTTLFATTLLAAILPFANVANAQSYPNRPITLIMPVAAGGPNDTAGRVVAQRLGQMLGQTIVVENRAGAGGTIANAAAARAAPDGYTLLFATAGTYVQSAALYKNLSYDITRDFIAVSQSLVQPLVMSTSLGSPPNLKDFIAYAKANPGKMNYGSAGHATSGHLGGLLFSKVVGINAVHVPFRAASAVSTAMMQNEVQFFFDTAFTAKPHVDNGKLRVLGVAGDRRSNAMPDVPTFIESGYPGFTAQTWAGIVVPAGTPREIVDRLHAASKEAVASKEVQAAFDRFDTRAVGNSPAEFTALIAEELAKWKAIAAEFNITVE